MNVVEKFYESKAPADAVELAIADHRGASPMPSFEFIAALQKAQAIAEVHETLYLALRAAIPCLARAINEGAFDNCAAPLVGASALSQCEAAIAALREKGL